MVLTQILEACKEALESYKTQYAQNSISPQSIVPLSKTLQSKNITLEDWNGLVRYVESSLHSDDTFNTNIVDLYNLLTLTLTDVDSSITGIDSNITNLNKSVTTINNTLTGVNTHLDTIDSSIAGINALIEQINADLNTKVTTSSEQNVVYGTDSSGTDTTYKIATPSSLEGVAMYSSAGTLSTNDPSTETNCANKKYVDALESALKVLLNAKLAKTGGTITGSLVITQDLQVNGTTTTTDTETLKVKDNIIMTNADGTELTALSGLVITIGDGTAYGIVYDVSTETVKLGRGTVTDNVFTFNEGEGNAVAIRDDDSEFTNGNLIQWDAVHTRFEDSGTSINELPKVNPTFVNGNFPKWNSNSKTFEDSGKSVNDFNNFASKNTTPSSLNWTNANGVETSMSFNSSVMLTSDNDLNDIKTYGIYQIYTNSTPLNTPKNIVQNAILVVLKSNLLPHCCQLYIGTSRYFIRYWTSADWTSWQELAVGTKVPTIRSLTKDDDLNNLTEYAMYQIYYQSDVANLPKNLPSGLNTNSIVNVYQVYSGNTAQVINTANNTLYLRYSYNGGTTWSAWTQTATTDYVDAKIDSAIINAINGSD